jgi:flavin reductase (DIM6/NTAB) family NADH-FMN oxidoreductase RutF
MDAPVVKESPIRVECQYMKSVDVGEFTCVIGKVLSISVCTSVLSNGEVDVAKLKPLTRCGYTDKYALVTSALRK